MSSPTASPADAGSPNNYELEDDIPTAPILQSFPDIGYSGMTRSQAFNLYTTHFLSTWNVRSYEFAAIIFTAAAYPDTLIAASIRGIVRTLASICFSSAVGRWVDQGPNRLRTLLSTISINRISVIVASTIWLFIINPITSDPQKLIIRIPSIAGVEGASILKGVMFTMVLLLGILENLSASGNMLSMERDWVIAASSPDGKAYDLTHLNSAMRRIDLVCKLIAPILISIIVSATSVKIGVLVVGAMSAASWAVETWCARRVWSLNPRLREPRSVNELATSDGDTLPPLKQPHRSCWIKTSRGSQRYAQDFKNYFSSMVWIPSLSLAFLHISALTYSATFITYLLTMGFSLDLITIARAAGSIVEISSTVVTPVGVQILSKAQNHGRFRGEERRSDDSSTTLLEGAPEEECRTETGLERLGLWGISFQLINLAPVVFALWQVSPNPEITSSTLPHLVSRLLTIPSQPLLAFILFFFLSISRLGLWIYDLTTQQLTQTMVTPTQRSSFTGVEYSFVSLFELAQFVVTIVLHKPEQFKWIAAMSWIAVLVSTVAYAGWVWKMRGHLVHWERIGKGCECVVVRHGHERRGAWRRIGDTLSLRGRSQGR